MTLKPLQPKSVMLTARRYGRYCVNDLDAEYAKFALNYSNAREGSIPSQACVLERAVHATNRAQRISTLKLQSIRIGYNRFAKATIPRSGLHRSLTLGKSCPQIGSDIESINPSVANYWDMVVLCNRLHRIVCVQERSDDNPVCPCCLGSRSRRSATHSSDHASS